MSQPIATISRGLRGARGAATREDRAWEIELTAGSGRLDVSAATALLTELVDAIAAEGGGPVNWRVPEATEQHRTIATATGFSGDRKLVQLRRPLPHPDAHLDATPTRPFDPERDVDDWLRVNNAAFAWHPEQRNQSPEHLRQLMSEPWFDPDGFLVHPPDGPLDGFCWTKVHHEIQPPLGEIFVIGVDPTAAGRGLGRGLVLAGLHHLADRGLRTAMLYTEADNAPARRLYQQLGFAEHHAVTVFRREVES